MRFSRFALAFSFIAALFGAGVVRAADMSFRLVPVGDASRCGRNCAVAIAAEGEITNDTPDAFVNFVRGNVAKGDLASVVFLDSFGGRVVSAMELGLAFRKLGMAAVVARPLEGSDGSQFAAGRCFSACVYALMGGRRRIIPPQSKVGIHRMFSYESARDPAGGMSQTTKHDDGDMKEVLARYSASMGVSRALIDYAERTSSESIHVLSAAEISHWHLGDARLSSVGGGRGRRHR